MTDMDPRGKNINLAECPQCHRKQSARDKNCTWGKDLDKAKRSKDARQAIEQMRGYLANVTQTVTQVESL